MVVVCTNLLMDITSVIRSLKSPPVTGWTKSLVWHGTVSAFVGVILGMIISLIVNVALVEISVSPFFGLVSAYWLV